MDRLSKDAPLSHSDSGGASYFFYALPAIPLAIMAMTYYVYLPKYLVDYRAFPIFSLSMVILFSRFWDALLDPLIGRFSDRGGSDGPNRKRWIAIAFVPLAISFVAFFYWPANTDVWAFFVVSSLFFLFLSAVLIPFEAWGITLATDYDQRNSIMSWREGFVIVGTLLSGAIPFLFEAAGYTQDGAIETLALYYSIFLIALVAITLKVVPEPANARYQQVKQGPFLTSFKEAWDNKPFRILIIAYVLSAIGAVIPATLILFYVEHVLQSGNANLFLSIYFLAGIVTLPLWLKLSRTLEKKNIWLYALTLNTGAFLMVYFVAPGQEIGYGFLVALSGVGFGATMAIPPSMQADVIDYDEYLHSTRREGLFVGFWAIARKVSAAIAASSALLGLSLAGYESGSAPEEEAVYAIRVWYTLVPCLFNLLAIVVASRYQLNRERLSSIKLEVENR